MPGDNDKRKRNEKAYLIGYYDINQVLFPWEESLIRGLQGIAIKVIDVHDFI